jgi:hypothetical protein
MIKFKLFALLILCVLFGCNNSKTSTNEYQIPNTSIEFKKFNDFLEGLDKSSQIFNVSSNKPSKVNGKKGTIIFLKPHDLVTENGQPLGKTIQVELKELTNQSDMLKANAPTVSNGRLLVSGGAYFINLTSDNNTLKLKEGKSLSVQFSKLTNKEMSLFYGERDDIGQMNWKESGNKFENNITNLLSDELKVLSKKEFNVDSSVLLSSSINNEWGPDRFSEDTSIQQSVYNELMKQFVVADYSLDEIKSVYDKIDIKQLGWINCDRFLNIKDKTNIEIAFKDKKNTNSVSAYLVFKDINSIMRSDGFFTKEQNSNLYFTDIPVNAKVKLIAFTIKDGKSYSYKSDFIIKANQTIDVVFKETTQEEMKTIFE